MHVRYAGLPPGPAACGTIDAIDFEVRADVAPGGGEMASEAAFCRDRAEVLGV